ncbi:MAG: hypothetical protein J3K34DRAFT_520281 [Monoraphidium minutum]|nr:MAG: hypothetical protein J3K34DRAFT_520281 [Monoraphidium minutum]
MGSDVIAHFETGVYRRNATFLGDEEYGRALDALVKACADVLMRDTETGEILIMRRIVHPQPDWWFVGGRMKAGDTPLAAAAKNVKRETGLELPPERFTPLCTMSMLWQKRKQEPADNGTADISVVFLVGVTPQERAALAMDGAEYDASAWLPPRDVTGGDGYHPALRRRGRGRVGAAQSIVAHEAYARLEAALASAAGDAAVAAAAAELVAAKGAAAAMEALPVPFAELRPGAGA